MPLYSATYCALNGKIYGMMGPYIVQLNGTTGAKEAIARVAASIEGPCAICYHSPTSKLYVAPWFDPAWVDQVSLNPSDQSLVFPVTPSTLAVGAAIDIITLFADFQAPAKRGLNGPFQIVSDGVKYLYLAWRFQNGGGEHVRFDPSNTVDKAAGSSWGWSNWNSMQFDGGSVSGVASIIWPDPDQAIYWGKNDFTGVQSHKSLSAVDETPVALVYDGTFAWAVCGNKWLIKCNLSAGTYTTVNLENGAVISGALPGVRPFHIRGSGTSLYIPCQNKDCVIVYDIGAGTGVLKTGFDGPVDVVFTPTKAFAVQSGPVGLKEIV